MEHTDTAVNLVINRLSRATYNELSNNSSLNPFELYLIDDVDFDIFNKRIVNLEDPVNDKDGVNLGYLDTNYISTKGISAYIDNERIYNSSKTSSLTYDGKLYEKRLEEDDWVVTVESGKYKADQITVFYYGIKG